MKVRNEFSLPILTMANMGLRPDEAARLEFRDVSIIDDEATGETILEIEVRGKRGVGYCKSTTGAVRPFQRLVKRNSPEPTNHVFQTHRQLFNTILAEEGRRFEVRSRRQPAHRLQPSPHLYLPAAHVRGGYLPDRQELSHQR